MGYAGEVDGGREVVAGSTGFKDPLLGGEVNNTNLPEIRSFNYEYKLNFRIHTGSIVIYIVIYPTISFLTLFQHAKL